MNFKNKNNNENMNNEVELNNNKGEIKMNDKKICPRCNKEFEPIEFITKDLMTEKETKKLTSYCPECLKELNAELKALEKKDTAGIEKKERYTLKQPKIKYGVLKGDTIINKHIGETYDKNDNIKAETNGTIQKRPHKKTIRPYNYKPQNQKVEKIEKIAGVKKENIKTANDYKKTDNYKELKNIKDEVINNPEALLKIKPVQLKEKAGNYMVNMPLSDYKKNVDLTFKLLNANRLNNAIRSIKEMKGRYNKVLGEYEEPYNISINDFMEIAPTIYKECEKYRPAEIMDKLHKKPQEVQNGRIPQSIINKANDKRDKLNKEYLKLINNGVNVNESLLWNIYNIQQGIKALNHIGLEEINKYVGIVQYLFKNKGWQKTISLMNKLSKFRYQYLRDLKNNNYSKTM